MEIRNENRTEKNCPCCGRHCPSDALSCGRGMEYFGVTGKQRERGGHGGPGRGEDPNAPLSQRVLGAMRRCGHYLHHNAGHGGAVDSEALLAALSEREQQELLDLLNKCMQGWEV